MNNQKKYEKQNLMITVAVIYDNNNFGNSDMGCRYLVIIENRRKSHEIENRQIYSQTNHRLC